MTDNKEIQRVGSLFSTISDRSKPFLEKCSKTKFLAVNDYNQAKHEYVELVRETLNNQSLGLADGNDCQGCLSNVRTALESSKLNSNLIAALEELRLTYLESMLKPAFRRYLQTETYTKDNIERLYLNALKIDSLIEVIQFMNRLKRIR